MGNMMGKSIGDAFGTGGLGLKGSGGGGGGTGNTIGIGAVGTRGMAGGNGGYGSGALGHKTGIDPNITSSTPEVMGSLDPELIRRVIKSHVDQIRYCYELQLPRFPKLNGKVAVRFIITGMGSVATSSVAQSTVGNSELEQCITGRVRTWLFPKPKGGGTVVVTYPFVLKQAGE
jgi:TonB family protein